MVQVEKNRNRYFRDYNKGNLVRFSLNLNRDTDKDIIEAIERSTGSKQGAIKSLIRRGLA